LKKIIGKISKYNIFIFLIAMLFAGFTSFNGSLDKSFNGIYVLDSVYMLLFLTSVIDVILKNKEAKSSLPGFIILGFIVLSINWLSCWCDGLSVVVFKTVLYGYPASLAIAGILYNFYPDSKKEDQLVV